MKCEQCGKIFQPKIDIEARFCSDKCRQAYWNMKRKISRLEDIARKAAQEIKRIRDMSTTHSDSAAASLKSIEYWLLQDDNRF